MGTSVGARHAGRGCLAFCLLVLTATLAAPAGGQTPDAETGVKIAPAKIQRDLDDRAITEEITVINNDSDPRRITLSIAGLGHDLDGAPTYLEQGRAPGALTLSEREFTLAPRQSKKVSVAGAIPSDARSLYAAVIAEFASLTPQAGQIEVRSRVATLMLYRAPKPWRESADIVDVQIIPGADGGSTRVAAAIKATGNVHVKPTGTATITKGGTKLATVALFGQLIIPEFTRRLNGTWTPPRNLTGEVTVVVRTQNPPGELTKTIDLGGGVAQRPQAEIVNLRGSAETSLVGMTLRNKGSVPITPVVTLFARQGGVERSRAVLPQKELKPGASQEVSWDPKLGDGTYLVTAQLKSGQDLLDEDTTDLRIGALPTTKAAPKRGTFIALAALLLVVVVAGLLMLLLRKKRDDDGPQPGPGAHAPVRETVGAGTR